MYYSIQLMNRIANGFYIALLQCKQPERDQEREQLRRELQYTKNHFSSLHLSQDVPDNVSEIEVIIIIRMGEIERDINALLCLFLFSSLIGSGVCEEGGLRVRRGRRRRSRSGSAPGRRR